MAHIVMAYIVMVQAIGACIDAARLEFDVPTQNKVRVAHRSYYCGSTIQLTVHTIVD